jgi:tetratricopeptide (TPR) repeat protein
MENTPMEAVSPVHTSAPARSVDSIETTLRGIAYNVFIGAFGLVPLLFLPVAYAPFDYTKTLFVVLAVLVAVIFFSLSVLRSGKVALVGAWPLFALWGVTGAAVVSALLSGDMYDAVIGDNFGVHTTLFVGLLTLIASFIAILGQNKTFVMRLYVALAGSAVILGLFQFLRIVFGADFLSFGVFTSNTNSVFGGWNDLALFFGLTILISLVALEQLPLTKIGRSLFSAVVAVALIMLAIVNFFAVWLVLALVSLMVLMYALTKDRLIATAGPTFGAKPNIAVSSIVVSASVFVCSLIFVIGGTVVGGAVSKLSGITYVEVRPSLEATIDVTRQTYSENAFVGIGPNKFVDAWRLYKDQALNETIFWSTDFVTGSGYIPTQFVTMGILGVVAWVSFMVLFVWSGLRMLFAVSMPDKFWYFIGSSSFVAATYLWGMSFVYTPGVTVLLLAALFTGITCGAAAALTKERVYLWSIDQNRRAGFVLVGVIMLLIVGSSSSLYYIGRHYAAVYTFAGAVSGLDGSTTIAEVEQTIAQSFTMVQSDQFARQIALYQLAKMNALIGVKEPTPEQQQEFQLAAANGVSAAEQAVALDPTDPLNTSTLGGIFSMLAAAGVDGALDRAREAYNAARLQDPKNPSYALLEAQLLARTGSAGEARAKIAEAVSLKSNYTDALFFLTQIDVAEGKVADAIKTTQSIISLEPNNPARYYQLGVLYSSDKKLDEAIVAFERAVSLDQNYANARYFLALGYLEKNNRDGAREQLEAVLALNPGNTEVERLIADIDGGRTFDTSTAASTTEQVVDADSPVETEDGTVTTTEAPDTSLIAPVNPVSETGGASAE